VYPTNLSPTAVITSQTPGESDGYEPNLRTPYVVQVSTEPPPPPTTTTTLPTNVVIPNVVGMAYTAAAAALEAVGLYAANPNGMGGSTIVGGEAPPAGATELTGQGVNLVPPYG
jgi:hypothetical protein